MGDKLIRYEDLDYIFYNIQVSYEINEISPFIELYRLKLMKYIKEECNNFFMNHKINININNILPRWIMLQFKDRNYYVDPIFPYNGEDNTQLRKDIYYLSNKKISIKNADLIINDLNLKNKFNNAINKLRLFIDSDYYKNDCNFYNIEFNKINNYYQILLFIHNNILEYKLSIKIVDKIIKNYKEGTKLDNNLKKIIVCIIIRYNTLESENQQAAVLPELYEYLDRNYNINGELFASSLNFFNKNYCSIYNDIELKIGSIGNFFTMEIIKGFYVANPPFDDTIMKNMSIKLINCLKESKDELSIFITIPEWDKAEYGGFECLEILKKSGYIEYIEKIDKKRVVFYDYYENNYKNLVSVYFILIQNKKGKKKHLINKNLGLILTKFFPL